MPLISTPAYVSFHSHLGLNITAPSGGGGGGGGGGGSGGGGDCGWSGCGEGLTEAALLRTSFHSTTLSPAGGGAPPKNRQPKAVQGMKCVTHRPELKLFFFFKF